MFGSCQGYKKDLHISCQGFIISGGCATTAANASAGGRMGRSLLSMKGKNMNIIKRFIAVILVLLTFFCAVGCKKKEGFSVPDGMTREEAALFTAIARVCPKDDNHSKVEYLTFYIEGWSFDTLPQEINDYLVDYAINGKAALIQMDREQLKEQGFIVKGDGDFFSEEEDTYMLGKGKIFTFKNTGDPNADTLVVRLTGYISDNDCSGYDIEMHYENGKWVVDGLTNPWSDVYMKTPEPGATPDPDIK